MAFVIQGNALDYFWENDSAPMLATVTLGLHQTKD